MFARAPWRRLAIVTAAVLSTASATPIAVAGASCNGAWQLVRSDDHSQQSGEIDSLNAVAAVSGDDQWAVGSWAQYPDAYTFHALVEHWDGSSSGWTVVPSPTRSLNSTLRGVASVGANDVWAVGGTDQAGDPYQTLVEHWDGTSWSIVPGATFPGVLYAVVAVGANDIWAVGSENYPGRGLIEHWDGISWTATYLRFAALLRGVDAIGPGDVWAVGQRYGRTNPFGDTALTLHFNGRVWTAVRSVNPLNGNDTDQNWLTSVSAVGPKDVWSVGRYGNHDLGTADRTLIEHWNGARWTVIPSPNRGGASVDNDLWGVASLATNDVWALGGVGTFLSPDSAPLGLHWDGLSWTHASIAEPAGGELLGAAGEPGATGISAVGDTVKPALPSGYVGTVAEHLCPS